LSPFGKGGNYILLPPFPSFIKGGLGVDLKDEIPLNPPLSLPLFPPPERRGLRGGYSPTQPPKIPLSSPFVKGRNYFESPFSPPL